MLIEINVFSDATKHGFKPAEVEPTLPKIAALSSLEIRADVHGQSRRRFGSRRRELLVSCETPQSITASDAAKHNAARTFDGNERRL